MEGHVEGPFFVVDWSGGHLPGVIEIVLASDVEIMTAAIAGGMSTMQEVGVSLVRSGVTTASAALRAVAPAQKAERMCGVAA